MNTPQSFTLKDTLAMVVLLVFTPAMAQGTEPAGLEPLPEATPSVERKARPDASRTEPARDVTMVEEIRVRGRVYMVKVTPKVGATYYLLDADSDGITERRLDQSEPHELDLKIAIPYWKIATW